MDRPETMYAWNGDVALAYQVVGEGDLDLLYLQGWASNIDLAWDSPYLASFLRGLASHGRLILTDRRGWGSSDRFSPSDVPAFEALTDDLLAVMDVVGSERPVVLASAECAPVAVLLAATYPHRLAALILCDPLVNYTATGDAPGSGTPEEWDDFFRRIRDRFPQPMWWDGPPDHPERDWFFRYVRGAVTPGALIAEMRRFLATDFQAVLPLVHVPTLVMWIRAGTEIPILGTDGSPRRTSLEPRSSRWRTPGA